MSQTISQSFINELLARIDIVELVDNRVTLKRSGSNFAACCPFHTEKTPSFTVSPNKQFYYCFGCGAHGNAIGFLMAYDRMEFVEAVEHLAHRAGLEIPRDMSSHQQVDSSLYALLEKATEYYQNQLTKHPGALTYLQKRGLSADMIKQFRIGFAPDSWDALQALAKTTETQQQLIQAGMLIKNANGKIYDRFRNRIMYPLRDTRGRIIAFGGRTLGDELPKYLNSPETPIFHKSSELYGLYEARQADAKLEKIIVVEGYMDVIALVQQGISYAVATLGTATNPKHLQRLSRYAHEIIFCFDGDRAGLQAAKRALDIALPQAHDGLQIRFMFLPQGEDPDTLVRKEGAAGFNQRITQALSLADFFFNDLSSEIDVNTLDGKARLAKLAMDRLNKMPHGVFQQLMFQRLNELVGMDVNQLSNYIPENNMVEQVTIPQASTSKLLAPVNLALALLLQHPHLAQYSHLPESLANVALPGLPTLCKLYAQAKSDSKITTGALLEYWRDTKQATQLAKLAAWELLIPKEGVIAEFTAALENIINLQREEAIQQLLAKANKEGLETQEKQQLMKLLAERQAGTI